MRLALVLLPLLSPETLLPTGTGPEVRRERTERTEPRRVVCGYCESTLAANGDVLRTSDRVKALNKLEEKIEKLEGQIAKLTYEVADRERERDEARAALAAKTRPAEDDDDEWE